jgi:predicted transposase/invertase (TIGR01784 family)
VTSRPHDALFKAAFEHPVHAAGLLRSILPESLCQAIRWDTLAHEPGSFIDPDLADTHSDLLFSARLGANHAYLYLLFEHLSTQHPEEPRRVLRYLDGVWERGRQPNGRLPIVIPVLVCHAPGGFTAPVEMQALFDPPPDSIEGLAPYVPHFRLLVEDLPHVTDEQLRSRALAAFPMLALWLLRDARDSKKLLARLASWTDTFRAASRASSGMQAVAQLLRYVYWVCPDLQYQEFRETIRKQLPESEEAVMTIAEQLIQQGRAEGRMEGRMEGRAEGRIELLEQQILEKFGTLPPALRERLASATDEQFARWSRRVLRAETLDAMFAD